MIGLRHLSQFALQHSAAVGLETMQMIQGDQAETAPLNLRSSTGAQSQPSPRTATAAVATASLKGMTTTEADTASGQQSFSSKLNPQQSSNLNLNNTSAAQSAQHSVRGASTKQQNNDSALQTQHSTNGTLYNNGTSSNTNATAATVSLVSSVDAARLHKIAERMCGLRGLSGIRLVELNSPSRAMQHFVAQAASAASTSAPSKDTSTALSTTPPNQAQYQRCCSGVTMVQWLCEHNYATSALNACSLLRQMLALRYIVPVCEQHTTTTVLTSNNQSGGQCMITPDDTMAFHNSPFVFYRFNAIYHWSDELKPNLINGVTQQLLDRCAARSATEWSKTLCDMLVHNLDRVNSNTNQNMNAAPGSNGGVSSKDTQKLQLAALRQSGHFYGTEFVKHIKRQNSSSSAKHRSTAEQMSAQTTADALMIGNWLLARRYIEFASMGEYAPLILQQQQREAELAAAATSATNTSVVKSSNVTPQLPTSLSVFRNAEVLYRVTSLQSNSNARLSNPNLNPAAAASSLVLSPAANTVAPSTTTAAATATTTGDSSTATAAVLAPSPSNTSPASTHSEAQQGLISLISRAERFRPVMDAETAAAAAREYGSSMQLPPAEEWEFVQSFGDDATAYDFDDADDLVTAVEFSSNGQYLAIGDKAGRISVVQESSPPNTALEQPLDHSTDSVATQSNATTDAANQQSVVPGYRPLEYKFFTEFQSHDPEFDALKSLEIECKINCIEWWNIQSYASNLLLLTSNDKTVKLWRLNTRRIDNGSGVRGMVNRPRMRPLRFDPTAEDELIDSTKSGDAAADDAEEGSDEPEALPPVASLCKRAFRNGHTYNIHSLRMSSDQQTFLTCDDLRLLLWNIETVHETQLVIDLKPVKEKRNAPKSSAVTDDSEAAAAAATSEEDPETKTKTSQEKKDASQSAVDELMTVANFHPEQCSELMYGSSKGIVRIVDLRQRCITDRMSSCCLSIDNVSPSTTGLASQSASEGATSAKTYFNEITDSILDAKYSADGRIILTRDYMTCRLWDIRMVRKDRPIYASAIHPHLHQYLIALLENECIFDQFQCGLNRHSAAHMVTGTYGNCFTLCDVARGETLTIKARDDARECRIVARHRNEQQLSSTGLDPSATALTTFDPSQPATTGDALVTPLPVSPGKPPAAPTKPPAWRKKILKCAWHPHMSAVAVAGLYKLYLYQTRTNQDARHLYQ